MDVATGRRSFIHAGSIPGNDRFQVVHYMKWREPWRESIGQTWSLPGSLRRLGRGFLVWFGVFAAILVVYALVGKVGLEDLPGRAAGTSAIAAAMAVVLHLV
ncbi:hypothetical protein [Luteimonas sp. YGD11-2]|uniref:hypothetical protein n=1 Tax=Luteimonas sp. YGD11-2 TaxID=2508168 RepID=UPI00100B1CCD|nr:hypothetical protein [Luteimonas sp. YGD11-2]